MTGRRHDHLALTEMIADRVLDHPAVAGLHGGEFGTVATLLPGRRLVGVLVDEVGGSVQIAIVAKMGAALPGVVADLRARVTAVAGPVAVDVVVADVTGGDAPDDPGGGAKP